MDRNGDVVPGSRIVVGERKLTTGLNVEGW